MSKSKTLSALTRADIIKFRPRKAYMPMLTGIFFGKDGTLESSDLETYMHVKDNHVSNVDVVLSANAISQLVKMKDWPSQIDVTVREYVEEVNGEPVTKKHLTATVLTEKGYTLEYQNQDIYDGDEWPRHDVDKSGGTPRQRDINWHGESVLCSDDVTILETMSAFIGSGDDATGKMTSRIHVQSNTAFATDSRVLVVHRVSLDNADLPATLLPWLRPGKLEWYKTLDLVRLQLEDGSWLATRTSTCPFAKTDIFLPMLDTSDIKGTWASDVSNWKQMVNLMQPFFKATKGRKPFVRLHADGKVEGFLYDTLHKKTTQETITLPSYSMPCDFTGIRELTAAFDLNLLKLHVDSCKSGRFVLKHKGSTLNKANVRIVGGYVIETQDGYKRLLFPVLDSEEIYTH